MKKLTPPPLIVQVQEFGRMEEGMIARFTIWLGPLPIRWKALHQEVSINGFTDVQLEGPAASWHHTHRFTAAAPHRTRIHEHIEYRHGGLASRLLFPKAGLYLLFSYRKWVTRRELE